MKPDLVLQERSSSRLIILDTKFTAHSFLENQWGKEIFDSAHLYQLYAYLKSQEHLSDAHRTAMGILLYPVIDESFSERIELQDHIMRAAASPLLKLRAALRTPVALGLNSGVTAVQFWPVTVTLVPSSTTEEAGESFVTTGPIRILKDCASAIIEATRMK